MIYLFALLLSFSLALYTTPVMREAALRFGIVDRPDGVLKDHAAPVAYLGGLAVYLSFLITLALVFEFNLQVIAILLAGTIIIILGLVDDFGFLTPGIKLFGQLIAVWVLIKGGLHIHWVFLPTTYGVPVIAYILSAFWLVGVTNAFNIIDIMDGLASTVGAVACLMFFGVAYLNGYHVIAAMTIALAGSLMGFLRYNRNPAQIFLGDTGAMFIGMMLGSLAMIGGYTRQNHVGILAPVLILGVPIFDTFLVMALRWMKGQPAMWGSPDHYALRLRKMGLSVNAIVAISGAVTLALGLLSFFLMRLSDVGGMILCGAVGLVGLGVAIWVGRVKMPDKSRVAEVERPR